MTSKEVSYRAVFFGSIAVFLIMLGISIFKPNEYYSVIREQVHCIDSLCKHTDSITAQDLKIREKIATLDSTCRFIK